MIIPGVQSAAASSAEHTTALTRIMQPATAFATPRIILSYASTFPTVISFAILLPRPVLSLSNSIELRSCKYVIFHGGRKCMSICSNNAVMRSFDLAFHAVTIYVFRSVSLTCGVKNYVRFTIDFSSFSIPFFLFTAFYIVFELMFYPLQVL